MHQLRADDLRQVARRLAEDHQRRLPGRHAELVEGGCGLVEVEQVELAQPRVGCDAVSG